MTGSNTRKTAAGLFGIALTGLALSGSAFAMQPLSQGFMLAAAHVGDEGKCGEGKCGSDSKPAKSTAASKTAERRKARPSNARSGFLFRFDAGSYCACSRARSSHHTPALGP